MNDVVKIENLKEMILDIRGQNVLLDSDVAHIYGVETKRINEAVKNNTDKFPQDYMFAISEDEFADLRSKFSTAKFSKTRVKTKAFTEKGLYMLATILELPAMIVLDTHIWVDWVINGEAALPRFVVNDSRDLFGKD